MIYYSHSTYLLFFNINRKIIYSNKIEIDYKDKFQAVFLIARQKIMCGKVI